MTSSAVTIRIVRGRRRSENLARISMSQYTGNAEVVNSQ